MKRLSFFLLVLTASTLTWASGQKEEANKGEVDCTYAEIFHAVSFLFGQCAHLSLLIPFIERVREG